MGDELEAIASVLEAEHRVLQALTEDWQQLTDPVARERIRVKRDAHLQRFQRVNELLARRLG